MGQVVTDEAYNELEVENDRLTQQVAKLKRKIDKLMTEPTNTDKARYVIERLGLEWIEKPPHAPGCICYTCNHYNTPTFLDPAGRIQLLELMMKREDWRIKDSGGFISQIGIPSLHGVRLFDNVKTEYILQPGILLSAAYDFLKEKP
jgi:hypothetical protein